jgi:hypothetical protein
MLKRVDSTPQKTCSGAPFPFQIYAEFATFTPDKSET